MFAVYKRELRSYFTTSIGNVCIAMFLVLFNLLYAGILMYSGTSDVTLLFSSFDILLMMLFVPILTMRLFSEEKRSKTDQILLTSPISLTGIVFGKFLAALSLFAIALAATIPNIIILFIYGEPELWVIVGNYIGLLFLGASFIAIGVFISSLTESQVIASVVTFAIIIMMLFVDFISSLVPYYQVQMVINWFSIYSRYSDFGLGIFNPASIVYYISIIAIFIFLTIRALEKRRWS